jgi:hypothetical protein
MSLCHNKFKLSFILIHISLIKNILLEGTHIPFMLNKLG